MQELSGQVLKSFHAPLVIRVITQSYHILTECKTPAGAKSLVNVLSSGTAPLGSIGIQTIGTIGSNLNNVAEKMGVGKAVGAVGSSISNAGSKLGNSAIGIQTIGTIGSNLNSIAEKIGVGKAVGVVGSSISNAGSKLGNSAIMIQAGEGGNQFFSNFANAFSSTGEIDYSNAEKYGIIARAEDIIREIFNKRRRLKEILPFSDTSDKSNGISEGNAGLSSLDKLEANSYVIARDSESDDEESITECISFVKKLREKQDKGDPYRHKITKDAISGTGFVTFQSRKSHLIACQIPILSQRYRHMVVTSAPPHSDLLWPNLGILSKCLFLILCVSYCNMLCTHFIVYSSEYIDHASRMTNTAVSVMIVFWGAVLALITMLSNIKTLEDFLPGIKEVPTAGLSLVSGLLPVLIMTLFQMLIPMLFDYLSRNINKRHTFSDSEKEVNEWFFKASISI